MGLFEKLAKKEDSKTEKENLLVRKKTDLSDERKKEISQKLSEGGTDELKRLKAKYPSEDDKLKVKVTGLSDALGKIDDNELNEVVQTFKDKDVLEKKIVGKVFDKNKDIRDFLIQEVISYLNSKSSDFKDRLSDIRKNGKRVDNLNLQMISFPLKIKFFKANFQKKEFEKILDLSKNIEEKIIEFESMIKKEEELKKQEEENKEAAEKLKNQKEVQKQVADPNLNKTKITRSKTLNLTTKKKES